MMWPGRYVLVPMMIASFELAAAEPMKPSEAFEAGRQFGNANKGMATGAVNTGTASTHVPAYSTTSPESSYFNEGSGSITEPASQDVQDCVNTLSADDGTRQRNGHCEAVRLMAKSNNRKKGMFPIDRTKDPMLVQGKAVTTAPTDYTGSGFSGTGQYSACVKKTIQGPDSYDVQTCEQYTEAEEPRCLITNNIIVKPSEHCTPGTYTNEYAFENFDGSRANYWVDSFCAGGTIRVRCVRSASREGSFTVPLDDQHSSSNSELKYGVDCDPRDDDGGFRRHLFYYSDLACDHANDQCSVQMHDVPNSQPYTYSCPAGHTLQSGPFGSPQCVNSNCGFSSCQVPATQTLNVIRTWRQSFWTKAQYFEFIDNWDNQCAPYQARAQ